MSRRHSSELVAALGVSGGAIADAEAYALGTRFEGARMVTIARREQLSAQTFLWDVEAPDVARAARAGQFTCFASLAGPCQACKVSEFERFECDTVIVALGTRANPIIVEATPGIATNKYEYLVVDPVTQATNLPGVYAGGDITTGGATVILAMGAGRRAAASIAKWLRAKEMSGGVESGAPEIVAPEIGASGNGASDIASLEAKSVCPKCQRPVGDDDGICCAGMALSWHCRGCGKVSEGFAFPFGRCPLCGGELAHGVGGAGEPGTPGGLIESAIVRAFETELGGLDFYVRGGARREGVRGPGGS